MKMSALHLNIRSTNFESFKMFLSNLNFSFRIICFSQIWWNDSHVDNSSYELPTYVSVHQVTTYYKEDGFPIYINKNFEFKLRNDLSINCSDTEWRGDIGIFNNRKKVYLFKEGFCLLVILIYAFVWSIFQVFSVVLSTFNLICFAFNSRLFCLL